MFHNSLSISHWYAKMVVSAGGTAVDATAGNGNDTAFLAELVGPQGKVYAFDVQKKAIMHTKERLNERGLSERVQLILDSHANMEQYVTGPVDCVMFNLGRLPGSDHTVYTKPESTWGAVNAALRLIRPGGMIAICAYWGDPVCNAEYREISDRLRSINPKEASVLFHDFINQPNCPPAFFGITKI